MTTYTATISEDSSFWSQIRVVILDTDGECEDDLRFETSAYQYRQTPDGLDASFDEQQFEADVIANLAANGYELIEFTRAGGRSTGEIIGATLRQAVKP